MYIMIDAFIIINVFNNFYIIVDLFEKQSFIHSFQNPINRSCSIHVYMNDVLYSLMSVRILKQKKSFIVDVS